MRYRELLENIIPSHIEEYIRDWQTDYSQDGAWDTSRHSWQKDVIKFSKAHPVKYNGYLYRGVQLSPEEAEQLQSGLSITLAASESLLESWSKYPEGANNYFNYHASENLSAIIIKFKSTELDMIFDVDVMNDPEEAGEILCMVKPHKIQRENIFKLYVEDDARSVT